VKQAKGANVVRLVVALLAVIGGWLAWKTLFPSEEQRIRARLDQIVDTVNAPSSDDLGKLADAARLASFFTDDVTIDPGPPYPTMRGRDAVVAAAAAAGRAAGGFELSFADVQVAVGDGDTAHGAPDPHADVDQRPDNGRPRGRARAPQRGWRVAGNGGDAGRDAPETAMKTDTGRQALGIGLLPGAYCLR
jgi:ketosteroid isomerase-like protein